MLAVFLGLSSSLCLGLADFIGGRKTQRMSGLVVVLVSQIVGLAALASLVVLGGMIVPDSRAVLPILAAGMAAAVGLTALYRALAIGPMSIVAPIAATGAALPVIVGLLSGERPSLVQAIGLLAAGTGVLLATQNMQADDDSQRSSAVGVALALLSAICAGIALSSIDRAVEYGILPTILWARVASVLALGAVGLLLTRVKRAQIERHFPALLAVGLLDTAGVALFAAATQHGLLSVVAVTSSLYPIVTLALARTVLRERVRPVQAAGICTALVGVALLAVN